VSQVPEAIAVMLFSENINLFNLLYTKRGKVSIYVTYVRP